MTLTVLDVAVIAIVAISGLLALMRGFTREVLSLVAWGAAAVAALGAVLTPQLVEFASQYLSPPVVAKIALGGAVFLVVLIIVSLISVRLGDWVLDSAAGPFDRTLGLFYGLLRGYLLVVIAFLFYSWLTPPDRVHEWVRNAWSLPYVARGGDVVISFLPPDAAKALRGTTAATESAAQGGGTGGATPGASSEEEEGYKDNQQRVLDQLIESTQNKRNKQ